MAADESRDGPANIASLCVCLVGLIGLIVVVWSLKTGSSQVPRIAFLALLGMVAAPFYVAIARRPNLLFLIPPVVVIFLLYPIGSPHGIIYSRDPIFNFHFAETVLETGVWAPGQVAVYSRTYSYYPIGNLFLGIATETANVPGAVGYMWAEPLLRLIALPAIVYAIARRYFEPRVAALAMLFYLSTGSILFNMPVQQGVGVLFVGLGLLALTMISSMNDEQERGPVRVLFLLASVGVIMTHHLSSYVFAVWLGGLALLTLRRGSRESLRHVHLGGMFLGYYMPVLVAYTATLTYPLVLKQANTVESVFLRFIAPEDIPSKPMVLGRTFATFEILWLAGSIAVILLLAFLAVRSLRMSPMRRFVRLSGLVACALTVASLPLIATSLNFVTLRISEFTNLFLAPLAAVTVVRWVRLDRIRRLKWLPKPLRRSKSLTSASVLAVVVLVLMGGNLAPLSMRTYFEPPDRRLTDSPLFIGEDSMRAAAWSGEHFGGERAWGDQMAIAVFAGFSTMEFDFGQYRVFRNTTLDAAAWNRLAVGDYVIVNRYMTVLIPDFLDTQGPTEALLPAQVEKFAGDPHFSLIFQDATFSIYLVIATP